MLIVCVCRSTTLGKIDLARREERGFENGGNSRDIKVGRKGRKEKEKGKVSERGRVGGLRRRFGKIEIERVWEKRERRRGLVYLMSESGRESM